MIDVIDNIRQERAKKRGTNNLLSVKFQSWLFAKSETKGGPGVGTSLNFSFTPKQRVILTGVYLQCVLSPVAATISIYFPCQISIIPLPPTSDSISRDLENILYGANGSTTSFVNSFPGNGTGASVPIQIELAGGISYQVVLQSFGSFAAADQVNFLGRLEYIRESANF